MIGDIRYEELLVHLEIDLKWVQSETKPAEINEGDALVIFNTVWKWAVVMYLLSQAKAALDPCLLWQAGVLCEI